MYASAKKTSLHSIANWCGYADNTEKNSVAKKILQCLFVLAKAVSIPTAEQIQEPNFGLKLNIFALLL